MGYETMHTRHIDEICLRLNVLDRQAAWTSTRASNQIVGMIDDIQDRMETYLNEEMPGWRDDKKLGELFNRETR